MLASFWQKESKFCSICCSAWVMSIKTIIQFQSIIINYSLRVTIQRDYSDTSWVSNLSYMLKVILGYFFKHYSPVSVWQEHQFATFNPPLYQLKSGTISLFRQSSLYLKDRHKIVSHQLCLSICSTHFKIESRGSIVILMAWIHCTWKLSFSSYT